MNCHSDQSEESRKIKCFSQALYFFTLLFILQACTPNTINSEAPGVNEVKTGEKFTIILPENHQENYIWKLSEHRNKSVIDYFSAVWHGNEKGVYYNFVAVKPGMDTLHFTQFKMQDTVKNSTYIIHVTD